LAALLIENMHCRISEEEYVTAIKEEINKVVKLQEELDIDVLVHGEPEVSYLEAILLASACFENINSMISYRENFNYFCAEYLCSH
jgi:hypothetical protein